MHVSMSVGRRIVRNARLPVASRLLVPVILSSRLVMQLPTSKFRTSARCLNQPDGQEKKIPLGSFKVDKPMLMLAFTCKKCDTRSSHSISKQAYTGGTVMVTCPGCHNRHLIADHLKIFNDEHITIEDIMKAQGETVSQTTEDLVFEDIPESLKSLIGHYSKNAPSELKKKLDNEAVHTLPGPKDK